VVSVRPGIQAAPVLAAAAGVPVCELFCPRPAVSVSLSHSSLAVGSEGTKQQLCAI
jgi:hypothetical protein